MKNHTDVPLLKQQVDYRTTGNAFANKPTDLDDVPGTGFLTYSQLAGDQRVVIAGPLFSLTPLEGSSDFQASDYYTGDINGAATGNNLAGGTWHCVPTASAMWWEWLRKNLWTDLGDRSGTAQSIVDFAQAMDTDDINTAIRSGDDLGHLGTLRPEAVDAVNAAVDADYPVSGFFGLGPRVAAWRFTPSALMRAVDRDRPPVIFYKHPTKGGGHAVVGVGYDATHAIVRDPWDGMQRSKPFAEMVDIGDPTGTLYGDDPPSVPFDSDWAAVRLHVPTFPDWGDAPSAYIGAGLTLTPAAHRVTLREWLGSRVSSEMDPFGTDDEDDQPNTGSEPDSDGFDDGVFFPRLDVGPSGGQIQIVVSSVAPMVLDEDFETDLDPDLYLNAWVDWDQDTVWEAQEQIVDSVVPDGLDFDGEVQFVFDFDIPNGFDPQNGYWARVRLSRGEDVGPYGEAQFGEVEDHRVALSVAKTPVASAWGLLALALGLLGGGALAPRCRRAKGA